MWSSNAVQAKGRKSAVQKGTLTFRQEKQAANRGLHGCLPFRAEPQAESGKHREMENGEVKVEK